MIISSSGYLAAVIGCWDSRTKGDSLLSAQEAVCLRVVAGARIHLPANRLLDFRFEVTA